MTHKGQIANHFMEDLKRLAYWEVEVIFLWLYEFGLNVLLGIDVKKDKKYFRRDFTIRGL